MLYVDYRWGGRNPNNGIYMANNVAESCRIWHNIINNPVEVQGMYGNMDHLRPLLSPPEFVKPNTLYWLTDRTPHECLILKQRTYRTFFRLVSSDVSIWFDCSSTKNPLGVVPPRSTYIYRKDKFAKVNTTFSASAEVTRMLSDYSKFRPVEKDKSSEHESKTKKENKSKRFEKKPCMPL